MASQEKSLPSCGTVGGAQLLEISDKAPRTEAPALAERLKNLVPESKARQLNTSKTRFALGLFVP